MIASMTGYARAQGSDDRRRWVWEARSVNGRNLEIRCRVPQGFDRLENPARTAVGGRLKRGNVSLTLTLTSERQSKPLRINKNNIRLKPELFYRRNSRRDFPKREQCWNVRHFDLACRNFSF